MANADEIKAIELRRLAELEKRRAYEGLSTPPEVLLEISELRAKYGSVATAISREAGPDLGTVTLRDLRDEIDFLRALTTSALRRVTAVEEASSKSARLRNLVFVLLAAGLLAVIIRVY